MSAKEKAQQEVIVEDYREAPYSFNNELHQILNTIKEVFNGDQIVIAVSSKKTFDDPIPHLQVVSADITEGLKEGEGIKPISRMRVMGLLEAVESQLRFGAAQEQKAAMESDKKTNCRFKLLAPDFEEQGLKAFKVGEFFYTDVAEARRRQLYFGMTKGISYDETSWEVVDADSPELVAHNERMNQILQADMAEAMVAKNNGQVVGEA